jgi:hypothetical protein
VRFPNLRMKAGCDHQEVMLRTSLQRFTFVYNRERRVEQELKGPFRRFGVR